MAQYCVKDPEELIECPYDPVHMIRNKRLPYHLMKCRKNYTGSDYFKCPFNACHELPRPELRYHVANCTDKAIIEKDLLFGQTGNKGEGTYFRGCTEGPEPDRNVTGPPCRENWDSEMTPFPVQVVDKSVFTGKYRKDYMQLTQKDKLAVMERLKKRGIPLDDPLAKEEPETLRLPYETPRVLSKPKPVVPVDVPDTHSVSGRSVDEESEINLTKNVALLQILAAGRGKNLACDKRNDIEPLVGECSGH